MGRRLSIPRAAASFQAKKEGPEMSDTLQSLNAAPEAMTGAATPNVIPPSQPLRRFDGAEAWTALTPEQQAEIGAIALEYAVAAIGYQDVIDLDFLALIARPLCAAEQFLHDDLLVTTQETAPALTDPSELMPIPSRLGRICRTCGCSHYDPCEGGCGWAELDLCTGCATAVLPSSTERQAQGASW
jgi:hypothetical protein